jgi:hypothetical protein
MIVVWKDGTNKRINKNNSRTYENDPDWLCTIDLECL